MRIECGYINMKGATLDKDDDYLREADDAEELATKATSPRDRAAWHWNAQIWLDLIKSDDSGKSACK
jgi:hypothetical protein